MSGKSSVNIGGDAVGNTIIVGDENRISTTTTHIEQSTAESVAAQLELIRELFVQLRSQDEPRITRELDDARTELKKLHPRKHVVGSSMKRAIELAATAQGFSRFAEKLYPHVETVVRWLGKEWSELLRLLP